MKGSITITSKENGGINFAGSIVLSSEVEKYRLISGLAKCLGVNDAESWAKCVIYCLDRINDLDGMTRTEIQIPRVKGE